MNYDNDPYADIAELADPYADLAEPVSSPIKKLIVDKTPRQSKLSSLFGVGRAGRVAQGVADPFIAAAQLAGKGLEVAGVDYGKSIIDEYKGREAGYQAERQAAGQQGMDLARITGNIVNPATGLIAATAPATIPGGIAAGAAAGALTPSYSDNFASEKAMQAAFGTALGGLFPALFKASGALLSKTGKKITTESAEQFAQINPELVNAARENVKTALKADGIDISTLNASALQQIDDFVKKSTAAGIDPKDSAAVARKALLENLPVPIKSATKGQLTQDFQQKQLERIAADSVPTPAGRQIADSIKTEQPQKLLENVEYIKNATGGQADSALQFGTDFRKFVTDAYQSAKGKTKAAYTIAEKTTGDLPVVLPEKQIQWMTENRGFPGVEGLIGNAKALGIIATDEAGNIIPKQTTFKNLAQLRSNASKLSNGGGSESAFAGQLKSQIDGVFDEYGSSLYKQAAKLRREQGITYESGAKVVSDLLKKKSGSELDEALSDEKIFNRAVLNSSVDDVKKLYSFLEKKGGGKQIKDIRAMTAEHLKYVATGKGRNPNEFNGYAVFNEVQKMGGKDKLQVIYGKEGADEIIRVLDAAKILQDQGRFAAAGSQTASRLAMLSNAFADIVDKHLPFGIAKKTKAALEAAEAVSPKIGQTPARAIKQNVLSTKGANRSSVAASIATRNALSGNDE